MFRFYNYCYRLGCKNYIRFSILERLLITRRFIASDTEDMRNVIASHIYPRLNENIEHFLKTQESAPRMIRVVDMINSFGKNTDWAKVEKYLIESDLLEMELTLENIRVTLFVICVHNRLHNLALLYFKYIISKKELTPGIIQLFCRLVYENNEELKEGEDIIYKILLKLHINYSYLRKICYSVLLYSPKYHHKVIEMYMNEFRNQRESHTAAIDSCTVFKNFYKLNDLLKLHIYKHDLNAASSVFDFVKNYAIEKKKVPARYLYNTLRLLVRDNIEDIPVDLVNKMSGLFKFLDTIDKEFSWSYKNFLPKSATCPYCNESLSLQTVTEEECSTLLKNLLDNVIFKYDINIKSEEEEWKRFVNFVDKTSYNVVIDGLNVDRILDKTRKIEFLFSQMENLKLKPLILGRRHLQDSEFYDFAKAANFPHFLTKNSSHDDVFVLYAALKKGVNCWMLTRDKMKFFKERTSAECMLLYKRWKATSHAIVTSSGRLYPPRCYEKGVIFHPRKSSTEFHFHYIAAVLEEWTFKCHCFGRLKRKKHIP